MDKIVIADDSDRVYYDKNGNPMPDDFDPSNGGSYDKSGNYTMTAEEYAEYVAMSNRADEAIENGDRDAYGNVTEEGTDALWALLGI